MRLNYFRYTLSCDVQEQKSEAYQYLTKLDATGRRSPIGDVSYVVETSLPLVVHGGMVFSRLNDVTFEKVKRANGFSEDDVFVKETDDANSRNFSVFMGWRLGAMGGGSPNTMRISALLSLIAALPGVDLLTASGHGVQDKLIGQVDTVLEVGGYPPAAIRKKIVHLLACHCGERLGPDLVVNGCRAFFGYRDEFVFPLASPRDFLDCDGEVDRALAQGLTAEDVFDGVIKLFDRRIRELRQAGHNFRASLVEHNKSCFVAPSVDQKWGDPAATL